MFVFAIETQGKTVAFTKEQDRSMLGGILEGGRDEGQQMRSWLKTIGQWDGVSQLTARLATDSEEIDYDITTHEADITDDESVIVYQLQNAKGEAVTAVMPDVAYVNSLDEIPSGATTVVLRAG
jgi:hypothetical protein